MKISILVPTRDRLIKFEAFIDSLKRTTTDLSNIELHIAMDEDDTTFEGVEAKLKRVGGISSFIHKRTRSEFLNRDYYNWLQGKSDADLYWVLADDLEIVRPDWDTRVKRMYENITATCPDKIACISIRDNTPPPSHKLPKFPCFPMFTKEAIKAVGWMLAPNVPTWGADYVAYCIYEPVGRLFQMHDENYINHKSFHTKQEQSDPVNVRIGSIFNKYKMVPEHNTDTMIDNDVPWLRKKVTEAIKAYEEAHVSDTVDKSSEV